MLRSRQHSDERGATAVLVALSMVLLMGIAAVAIDLSFGFNERRQSQTAADMAVMAGATEVVLGGTQEDIVNQVLAFARENLNADFDDAEWQAIWLNCTDPDRIGFDVGTGTPVDFQPLPAPSTWGAGDIDCISEVASYLRVRVPDQGIDTTFGRVLGFQSLTTSAAAVAKIEPGGAVGGVLPFGIAGGTGNGEICLSSAPGGIAYPPCVGPSSGAFGTINSPFFGDFFGTAQCGNPGFPELRQNVALGIDHAIAVWPQAAAALSGVTLGSPHPGDSTVIGFPAGSPTSGYPERGQDRCSINASGAVVPAYPNDVSPPNVMQVSTGFADASHVQRGLIDNAGVSFLGEPPRLQQGDNPKRVIRNRIGGSNVDWHLDNKGLWDYLNSTNGIPGVPECNGSTYSGLTIPQKVSRMHTCFQGYTASGSTQNLFHGSIEDSPRLVWAPEYWHAASTTGLSWQPVHGFRLVFIAGTYFDCNAGSCEYEFYPDLASTDNICVPSGPHCKNLTGTLAQLTAFLLPKSSVPEDSIPAIPGQETGFAVSLFR